MTKNNSKTVQAVQSISNQQLQSLVSAASSQGGKRQKRKAKKKIKGAVQMLPAFLEAVIDPWSAPGLDFGEPDENNMPTVAWSDGQHMSIATDANGEFCLQIQPLFGAVCIQYLLSASGIITAVGNISNATANYSSISTTFSKYRSISYAYEVEYIGTEQAAKGVIGAAHGVNRLNTADTFAAIMDEPSYKEYSVTDGGSINGMCRCSSPPWNLATLTSMGTENPCQMAYVIGSGLPASTTGCVRVSIRMNTECLVLQNSLLSNTARITPHYPAVIATANTVTGFNNEIATGKDSKDKLVKKRKKIAKVAAELNGVVSSARSWMPIMAELAALL